MLAVCLATFEGGREGGRKGGRKRSVRSVRAGGEGVSEGGREGREGGRGGEGGREGGREGREVRASPVSIRIMCAKCGCSQTVVTKGRGYRQRDTEVLYSRCRTRASFMFCLCRR